MEKNKSSTWFAPCEVIERRACRTVAQRILFLDDMDMVLDALRKTELTSMKPI